MEQGPFWLIYLLKSTDDSFRYNKSMKSQSPQGQVHPLKNPRFPRDFLTIPAGKAPRPLRRAAPRRTRSAPMGRGHRRRIKPVPGPGRMGTGFAAMVSLGSLGSLGSG